MTIDWLVTLIAVHLLAFVGAASLFWRAPCWMQKLSVFLFSIALGLITLGYVAMLGERMGLEWWGGWGMIGFGLAVEHIAVLLYVFRMYYREHIQWPNSSAPSRNSPA